MDLSKLPIEGEQEADQIEDSSLCASQGSGATPPMPSSLTHSSGHSPEDLDPVVHLLAASSAQYCGDDLEEASELVIGSDDKKQPPADDSDSHSDEKFDDSEQMQMPFDLEREMQAAESKRKDEEYKAQRKAKHLRKRANGFRAKKQRQAEASAKCEAKRREDADARAKAEAKAKAQTTDATLRAEGFAAPPLSEDSRREAASQWHALATLSPEKREIEMDKMRWLLAKCESVRQSAVDDMDAATDKAKTETKSRKERSIQWALEEHSAGTDEKQSAEVESEESVGDWGFLRGREAAPLSEDSRFEAKSSSQTCERQTAVTRMSDDHFGVLDEASDKTMVWLCICGVENPVAKYSCCRFCRAPKPQSPIVFEGKVTDTRKRTPQRTSASRCQTQSSIVEMDDESLVYEMKSDSASFVVEMESMEKTSEALTLVWESRVNGFRAVATMAFGKGAEDTIAVGTSKYMALLNARTGVVVTNALKGTHVAFLDKERVVAVNRKTLYEFAANTLSLSNEVVIEGGFDGIEAICVTPKLLYVSAEDWETCTLKAYSTGNWLLTARIALSGNPKGQLDIDASGLLLAVGIYHREDDSHHIDVIETNGEHCVIRTIATKHTARINQVAFSPTSRRIASVSDDKSIQVFNALNGLTIFAARIGHSDSVSSVCWLTDERIVTVSRDKSLTVWGCDSPRFRVIVRIEDAHSAGITFVLRICADSFVTGDGHGYVKRWNVEQTTHTTTTDSTTATAAATE